jgi:hypothetical protein
MRFTGPGTAQDGIDRARLGRAARESREIEALGLDLPEVRPLTADRKSPESGDSRSL